MEAEKRQRSGKKRVGGAVFESHVTRKLLRAERGNFEAHTRRIREDINVNVHLILIQVEATNPEKRKTRVSWPRKAVARFRARIWKD